MSPINQARGSVLIVDLNNFATFPTLAIGLLVASLRNKGMEVQLLSPLAYDVPAAAREKRESYKDHVARRIHLSTMPAFRVARDGMRNARDWWKNRPHPRVLQETAKALAARPDAILLSAYLQHYKTVQHIGALAAEAGIPLLLGGPMFNLPEVADAWLKTPGLAAIVGAEVDHTIPKIVMSLKAGEDLLAYDGVVLPDGRRSKTAAPLRDLDTVPVPDFTDFPWDRYPFKIIPIMAARGCQWNKCTFCSDIISASGRTFRTRSADGVIHEMREQARRHGTDKFLFLDLKLNSNPALFRGIIETIQHNVPGAEWIGTVHVDQRRDSGLSRADLKAAVAAGMRRASFGLETGSQRLLDAMQKGSSVEANSDFIRSSYEAGLSIRATMFKGYPGETADDLELTATFLEKHAAYIDRIRMNEFSILSGTPIFNAVDARPEDYENIRIVKRDHRKAKAIYVNHENGGMAYRQAKKRVLKVVYDINRKEIRSSARAFDGLM